MSLTPRTTEILNTMKVFNEEADKFLLSIGKVETALMQIEDPEVTPAISETDLDIVVAEVLKHKECLTIVKAILNNMTMKNIGYVEHHISKIRLMNKETPPLPKVPMKPIQDLGLDEHPYDY